MPKRFGQPTTSTAIINGKEVKYDIANETEDDDLDKNYSYLGKGVIHKIDGDKQRGEDEYHFWKNK